MMCQRTGHSPTWAHTTTAVDCHSVLQSKDGALNQFSSSFHGITLGFSYMRFFPFPFVHFPAFLSFKTQQFRVQGSARIRCSTTSVHFRIRVRPRGSCRVDSIHFRSISIHVHFTPWIEIARRHDSSRPWVTCTYVSNFDGCFCDMN